MYQQYNIAEKIVRVLLFVVGVYLSIQASQIEISNEETIQLMSYITFVFLIYENYYPRVKIELKQ